MDRTLPGSVVTMNNIFLNQLVQRNLHLKLAKSLFDATWELLVVVVVCLKVSSF